MVEQTEICVIHRIHRVHVHRSRIASLSYSHCINSNSNANPRAKSRFSRRSKIFNDQHTWNAAVYVHRLINVQHCCALGEQFWLRWKRVNIFSVYFLLSLSPFLSLARCLFACAVDGFCEIVIWFQNKILSSKNVFFVITTLAAKCYCYCRW